MIGSLLWKEWREHRWKMLVCIAMLGTPIVIDYTWWGWRDFHSLWDVIFLISYALAIWMAAWTITSERPTQRALEALPVPLWKAFSVKVILGLTTFLAPMALVLMLHHTFVVSVLPDTTGNVYYSMLIVNAHLYLTILAVGMGARREGMAAMVGVLVFLGNFMAFAILSEFRWLSYEWLWMAFPIVTLDSRQLGSAFQSGTEVTLMQLDQCAVLWWIAALRYRRLSTRRVGAPSAASPAAQISRPLRAVAFPFGSLVWKAWREQRGVLIGGAAAGAGLAVLVGLASFDDRAGLSMEDLTGLLFYLGIIVPLIIAVVLGISVWNSDLEPGIETFWKSRSISPARVFWTKYAAGIVGIFALAAMFFGGALLCAVYAWYSAHESWRGSLAFFDPWRGMGQTMLWCPLLFTGTMLFTLLIRRPIYVGVLAVAGTVCVATTGMSSRLWYVLQYRYGFAITELILFGVTMALAVLASKSLQKNWRLN